MLRNADNSSPRLWSSRDRSWGSGGLHPWARTGELKIQAKGWWESLFLLLVEQIII